jgi:hypothetical protein
MNSADHVRMYFQSTHSSHHPCAWMDKECQPYTHNLHSCARTRHQQLLRSGDSSTDRQYDGRVRPQLALCPAYLLCPPDVHIAARWRACRLLFVLQLITLRYTLTSMHQNLRPCVITSSPLVPTSLSRQPHDAEACHLLFVLQLITLQLTLTPTHHNLWPCVPITSRAHITLTTAARYRAYYLCLCCTVAPPYEARLLPPFLFAHLHHLMALCSCSHTLTTTQHNPQGMVRFTGRTSAVDYWNRSILPINRTRCELLFSGSF